LASYLVLPGRVHGGSATSWVLSYRRSL
jgi:hypothetical protein